MGKIMTCIDSRGHNGVVNIGELVSGRTSNAAVRAELGI